MQNYLNLLQKILDEGHDHPDRTGVGRRSIFGQQLRFDLTNGKMPLVTTRKIFFKTFVQETLFFIRGLTNIEVLKENGVSIWDKWAVTEETYKKFADLLLERGLLKPEHLAFFMRDVPKTSIGEIGPMYGNMWRFWPVAPKDNSGENMIHDIELFREVKDMPEEIVNAAKRVYEESMEHVAAAETGMTLERFTKILYHSSVDQLNELVCELKNNPYSSRLLVTAFNPQFTPVPGVDPDVNVLLGRGCLMPCHIGFQCFVSPANEASNGKLRLSLKLSMRSVDTPVGMIYNIASYALLTHLLAHACDMEANEFVLDTGDTHIYADQIKEANRQLLREPVDCQPTISINSEVRDLFSLTANDITISGYKYHPDEDVDPIKYNVAI